MATTTKAADQSMSAPPKKVYDTQEKILAALAAKEITTEEASDCLDAITKPAAAFSMKVSEKGCVTFRGVPGANVQYGLSLRKESLKHLFTNRVKIEQFVKDNEKEIDKRSAESRAAAKAAKAAAK